MALRPDEQVLLQGKPHPLYRGVLREAHENGLLSLEATVLQYPAEENRWTAVCQATATFPGPDGRERIFTEIGDCSDTNCGAKIAPHKIRMAATRAKGRALRDALGIGEALVEEMGGNGTAEDDLGTERPRAPMERSTQSRPPANRGAREQPRPVRDENPVVVSAEDPQFCQWEGCGLQLTADEVRGCALPKYAAFFKGKMYCADHRKALKDQQPA